MRATGSHIGIATDGDADRFGIVDEDGTFLQPNYVIALLFDYLVESRGWKKRRGEVGGNHEPDQCDCQGARRGTLRDAGRVQVHWRTDHAGPDRDRWGGKRGLSIRHHVPEKDGLLAGLLCCEMVARRGSLWASN